jgi:hypothetical protein
VAVAITTAVVPVAGLATACAPSRAAVRAVARVVDEFALG